MLHIVIRTHGWWHVRTGPRIWYIIDYLNHIKKNNCLTEEKWADTTKMYRTSYDKLIINHMVKMRLEEEKLPRDTPKFLL